MTPRPASDAGQLLLANCYEVAQQYAEAIAVRSHLITALLTEELAVHRFALQLRVASEGAESSLLDYLAAHPNSPRATKTNRPREGVNSTVLVRVADHPTAPNASGYFTFGRIWNARTNATY